MARPENQTIATLDDVNATQQLIRQRARRLIDSMPVSAARDIEDIIRATERAQKYLQELRRLEHERPAGR